MIGDPMRGSCTLNVADRARADVVTFLNRRVERRSAPVGPGFVGCNGRRLSATKRDP